MASGRKRGGIRRGGWLHRVDDHEPEQSAAAPDMTGTRANGGDRETREPVGSGGGGEPTAPDTQASLDQVLRKADGPEG